MDGWSRQGDQLTHHASGGVVLALQGDIAAKHTDSIKAVVNAANAELLYGGGGTNAALSKAVTHDCWTKGAEQILHQLQQDRLMPGQAGGCQWEAAFEHGLQAKML